MTTTAPPIDAPGQRLAAELPRLVAAARAALPGEPVPAFAHLRVRSRGRDRDYLLGFQTVVTDAVSVLNWQTAPLAAVFFSTPEGSDYDVEVGGRTLSGTV